MKLPMTISDVEIMRSEMTSEIHKISESFKSKDECIPTEEDSTELEKEAKEYAKEKKYSGYGYHGGGRKPKGEESRTCTMSIVCTASEKEKIKQLAKESGQTISGYILQKILIDKR